MSGLDHTTVKVLWKASEVYIVGFYWEIECNITQEEFSVYLNYKHNISKDIIDCSTSKWWNYIILY